MLSDACIIGGQGAGRRHDGRDCRGMEIPKSFAAKILQKLVRAGIVSSFQGIKGGFRLARPADEITLYDVIRVIEGPLSLKYVRRMPLPATSAGRARCIRSG